MAYHHGGESGKEETHIEPAVLYQPLGGSEEGGSDQASMFGDEWFRIMIAAGSRCEQYGGHWVGHRCVGVRNHGGSHGGTCRTAAATTTLPGIFSGPPGWFAIVAGQLICSILGA